MPISSNSRRCAAWSVFSDRKSTRLNSSHEWISYAVFCLKKKNVAHVDDRPLDEELIGAHAGVEVDVVDEAVAALAFIELFFIDDGLRIRMEGCPDIECKN